ncbi:MAG: TetR/AcrR family transcriptional regulator [Gemmatimonadetes bacterium]|nr:TetR/AcrR family transcriptional regulator [Gemmatimonadota bacterium]
MTKGAATRDRIIQRAERIAGLEGLDGITFGVLAAELAMSKSGLFAHFGSREGLQLAVLLRAVDRFHADVLYPGLRARSGEPRLRSLVHRWLAWERTREARGGDLLSAAAFEFDDRPGIVRDCLVTSQRRWLATLAVACTIAIEAGHFRAGIDAEAWVREAHGVILAHRVAQRLLGDAQADRRAAAAMDELFARSREVAHKPRRRRAA